MTNANSMCLIGTLTLMILIIFAEGSGGDNNGMYYNVFNCHVHGNCIALFRNQTSIVHSDEEARRLAGCSGSLLTDDQKQDVSRELSQLRDRSDEDQRSHVTSPSGDAAEPNSPSGLHDKEGLCVFVQSTQGDFQPLDLKSDATVQDLVTAVEGYTRVPTAVSYAGRMLDQKDALLSDLGIAQEAIVFSQPMKVMRVVFEQISFGFEDVFLPSHIPRKDRIIVVPYLDDVLSATQLVDYIRNSLISKVRDGHWEQVLRGADVYTPINHQRFEKFLGDGGQDRIFVSLLPEIETKGVARGWERGQHLQRLSQKNVGIDQQAFDKMIEDMIIREAEHFENLYIYMKILD